MKAKEYLQKTEEKESELDNIEKQSKKVSNNPYYKPLRGA